MFHGTFHWYRWPLTDFLHLHDYRGKAVCDGTGHNVGEYNGKDQDCQVNCQQLYDQQVALCDEGLDGRIVTIYHLGCVIL